MSDGFGQNGLWDERDLGSVREPVPRRASTRVRRVRTWNPAGRDGEATTESPRMAPERLFRRSGGSEPTQRQGDDSGASTGRQGAQATQEPGAGHDARALDNLVYPLIERAVKIRPGDTVWYQGAPHVVRDVSLSGGFDYCVSGPCPPYYGLAGIESTVTRTGRRTAGWKLVEHGVTPHLLYTEIDGERIGWVSYLLCQVERRKEPDDGKAQTLVWWSRRKQPRKEPITF